MQYFRTSTDAGDQVGIYQCMNCKNVIGNDKYKSEETCEDNKYIYLQGIQYHG